MMKLPVKNIAIGISMVILGILFLTPIGAGLRTYVGVIKSRMTVSMKANKKLSLETYKWHLTNRDGRDLQFEIYKGRVVFLNFWATWCKPCVKELPEIQKLYKGYGEKMAFLLVTQEDSTEVNAFTKKRNLDLPVYYAQGPIPDVIFSKTIPTTYIIDKEGQIALATTGPSDWNNSETRSLLDRLIFD